MFEAQRIPIDIPGHIGSTAIDIPNKAKATVPPAKPSGPSVKLTPFTKETKQDVVRK